jgi:GT2 family glycosyltransferase
MKISASLVLYKTDRALFEKAISSFLNNSRNGVLFVIDNSPEPLSSKLFCNNRVFYHHSNINLGFGCGHNIAFTKFNFESDYHLILNPDVEFDNKTLKKLSYHLDSNPKTMAIMPNIIYPDGTQQYLCKLLPTPFFLIVRRFLPACKYKNNINHSYELRNLPKKLPTIVPMLSGCFVLIRTNIFRKINGFDDRFFMYLEDVDFLRRVSSFGYLIYYPHVCVIHHYQKSSYKNFKFLVFHILSAIKYFNKWGWFFDINRSKINNKFLKNKF